MQNCIKSFSKVEQVHCENATHGTKMTSYLILLFHNEDCIQLKFQKLHRKYCHFKFFAQECNINDTVAFNTENICKLK